MTMLLPRGFSRDADLILYSPEMKYDSRPGGSRLDLHLWSAKIPSDAKLPPFPSDSCDASRRAPVEK